MMNGNRISSSPRSGGRPGFTLVEMLVVVGIMSALAALALPAIVAARRSAQGAQCLSNLRQLGAAMLMYRDQTGVYPKYRAEYPPITNNYGINRPRWQWLLAPSLGGYAQNPDAIIAAGTVDPTYTDLPLDNKALL